MLKRPLTVRIFFALSLATTFVWTAIAAAQTVPFSTPLKAEKLLGLKVEDSDGQRAGTVRNLVVDTRSGQLKYVVVASGGFMGVHSTLRLAPSQIVSAATTKRETLAINVTTPRWKLAPVFKSSDLAALGRPERAGKISQYFGESETRIEPLPKKALQPTGNGGKEQTAADGETLKFASDLVGRRVVNRNQEKIGEVLDLLIGLGEPHQAFAIVSTGRRFRREHQYAIPLSVLNSTDGSGKLIVDMSGDILQQAPPFDQVAWQAADTNSTQIYTYSKSAD
jgi:sporulation protein YlmC with PRC-barrel domain